MSDESAKSAAEPAKGQPKPTGIQNESNNPNQNNPIVVPPVEQPPKNDAKAAHNQEKITKWELFERGVKIVECLALIGGVATAIFIGYQWKEMRKASGDAEKSLELNGRQLEAMQGQSYILTGQWQAMQKQSEVMQGQLDEMKQTRILDERAWMIFSEVTQTFFSDNQRRVFNVVYKNYGKTPAFNVQCVVGVTEFANQIKSFDAIPIPAANAGQYAPGDTGQAATPPIPSSVTDDIRNGSPAYIFGTIFYDDIFGHHHWSQFCYRIEHPQTATDIIQFSSMPFHNSCDDAQTNQTN